MMNVLITGASAGFGEALTKRLIAKGHRVIGCARRLDKLNAMAESLGESFYQWRWMSATPLLSRR